MNCVKSIIIFRSPHSQLGKIFELIILQIYFNKMKHDFKAWKTLFIKVLFLDNLNLAGLLLNIIQGAPFANAGLLTLFAFHVCGYIQPQWQRFIMLNLDVHLKNTHLSLVFIFIFSWPTDVLYNNHCWVKSLQIQLSGSESTVHVKSSWWGDVGKSGGRKTL